MKIILTIAVALVVTLTAVAIGLGSGSDTSDAPDATGAPAAPAVAPTSGSATIDITSKAAGEAVALVEQVAAAYRAAPTLVDTMTVNYQTPSGDQASSYAVALGADDSARMEMPGMVVTADGRTMYITSDRAAHKYVEGPIEQGVGTSFRKISGSRNLPIHLALRYDPTIETMLEPISFAQLRRPVIDDSGVTTVTIDGRVLREFGLKGENGTARVRVDPETKLLASVSITFTPARLRNRAEYTLDAAFAPRVADALPRPIAFAPGGRFRVTEMSNLYRLSPGEPAPDFTLDTLDGVTVSLAGLRGNVVVLDFWATWCRPCRDGLPVLERVNKWATQTGQPVRIFGLNGSERAPTAEARIAKAKTFWDQQGFTMPSLIDVNREAVGAYGISSIPVTVVIDPQGRIAKIHTGFDPRMDQRLQQEITEILAREG